MSLPRPLVHLAMVAAMVAGVLAGARLFAFFAGA